MKKIVCAVYLLSFMMISCDDEYIEYRNEELRITIEKGDEWLHEVPLFWVLQSKTPPQIAIWLEKPSGEYISTVYVSNKTATASWQYSNGSRKPESLPHWCYARGIRYEDGLYAPTKTEPVTDAMTGATPLGSFELQMNHTGPLSEFVVKAEFNHQEDFNDYFPKDASPGTPNYSGGEHGSGQPAVVYAAKVNLNSAYKEFTAELVGHSSSDGSDGNIRSDISGLTTARNILKRLSVRIEEK